MSAYHVRITMNFVCVFLDHIFDLSIILETRMECCSWIGLLHIDHDTVAVRHRQEDVEKFERNFGDTLHKYYYSNIEYLLTCIIFRAFSNDFV